MALIHYKNPPNSTYESNENKNHNGIGKPRQQPRI